MPNLSSTVRLFPPPARWLVLFCGMLALLLITHTLAAAGELQLVPPHLEFSTETDGAVPYARIRLNAPWEREEWRTRTDASWLTVVPSAGHGSGELQVLVDKTGLAPGVYEGNVLVRSSHPSRDVQRLAVRFVLAAPRGVSVAAGQGQVIALLRRPGVPFTARVTDRLGRAVAGREVTFKTVTGRTEPMHGVVRTDAEGIARFAPVVASYGAVEVSACCAPGASAIFRAVGTGWVSTFAGDGVRAYGGDYGDATLAHFNAPFGMAIRGDELLVVDYFNHALRAIGLDNGVVRPLAGTGRQGFSGDGQPALESVLSGPFGMALGSDGEVVFSDYYNSRIRRIDGASGRVQTMAGDGVVGYRGDGGPAIQARIDVPLDIAADSAGNIVLSDWHNHVVRRVDRTDGTIHTIAGTGRRGYNGEGDARAAALSTPLGLSFDAADNLYIADYGNNRVRRVDAVTGHISTVAGTGTRGFSGDGGPALFAQLNRPYNVFVDGEGGLFISDAGNHRLRHVDLASGVITTVAGNGEFDFDAAPALASSTPFMGPFAVTRDSSDNLYVAEYFGHRVRRIGAEQPPARGIESREARLLRQARQIFGELPREARAEHNPLTAAKASLGRALFHETTLSADGSVSCASCHPLSDYGMDGLPLAVGIADKVGTRNTPTVFNAALQDSQFWDGRSPMVEAQVREPLLHPKEMAMPSEAAVVAAVRALPHYRAQFATAFGAAEPVSFANISAALGAFQRRLLTPGAPIDRFIAGESGALDAQQLRGLEVFLREGCASCHAGPLLGGQDIHLIQDYPNTRAGDRFEFRKRLGNTHKFKVAPLRNVARTAPYLHDGRYPTLAASLGARLDAYMVREASISDRVELAPGELDDLIAFMSSLTGVIDPAYIETAGAREVSDH